MRLAEKNYGEAKGELLAALTLRPGDPEATNTFCWAAILSGSGREDTLHRMEAVMSAPVLRSPPLQDTLGVLLGEKSRPAEAEEVFAEAQRRCEQRDPACAPAVQQDLREHREALRVRRLAPAAAR
ncbi:MAG TPA: hypothetical protein VN317_10595 [Candidatus Methanoperedens sp.]|nr:hypothetical protein [Candidatus Methanoperedens sp.]